MKWIRAARHTVSSQALNSLYYPSQHHIHWYSMTTPAFSVAMQQLELRDVVLMLYEDCINVVWRLQRAPECWQLLARPFAVDYSWTVFIVRSVRPWHSALHPLAHCPSCPLPLWHSLQIPRLQYTTVAQGQYRQNRHPATQKTRPHGDKQTDRERERERQTWGQYYKRCLTLV